MANLVSNISNLATRTATEAKALRTLLNGKLTERKRDFDDGRRSGFGARSLLTNPRRNGVRGGNRDAEDGDAEAEP